MSQVKIPRVLRELRKANPGLTVTPGRRHLHIRLHGELIAIAPYSFAEEGFAENTKCQLRRKGVRLPG